MQSMSSTGAFARCRNATLCYPQQPAPLCAVKDLTWEVPRASITAIVGPTGCGKSTVLKYLAGLLAADTGTLEIDLPADRTAKDFAVTLQNSALLPWLTVRENALLPFRITGIEIDAATHKRLDGLLRRAGLHAFADAYPHQLSGGMRMRVAVVRAFLGKPRLITMDEPFAALDEITRETMCGELESLWLEERNTVVFATHNLSEAVFVSDKVTVFSGRPGSIVREIAVPFPRPRPPELRSDPAFVALAGEVRSALVAGQKEILHAS